MDKKGFFEKNSKSASATENVTGINIQQILVSR